MYNLNYGKTLFLIIRDEEEEEEDVYCDICVFYFAKMLVWSNICNRSIIFVYITRIYICIRNGTAPRERESRH